MAVLVLAVGMFLGLCICFALFLKWNEIRYTRKGLPPGTMGWPVFGETTEFLRYGPDFMKNQRARYGSLFKSHIFGCPTIISMDPELNRYILLNEGKGLVPGYPQSMLDILGKCNIAAVHGSTHKYIRGSLLSLIGPSMIKDQLLPKIDQSIRSFLCNWQGKNIDIQERTTEMALFISFKQILETESNSIYEIFKPEFDKLVAGALSLPINIPGSNYHYGFQGRKRVIKILRQIIKERRASSITHNDILGHLLRNEGSKYHLNDKEILDQVITIMYSGYETVSTTSMMAIKYLHDHPIALQQIREEHLAIRDRKKPGDNIDWDNYKSMSFTRAVIFETSRLATIVNGVLRKTTKDIELNGFIIPKGWRIYVYTREINYDPLLYREPLTFNPWRWLDKSLESRNYCFMFGGGSRLCPGKELGIVIISTFLHYFVTKYRWEEVGGDEILKFPRVEAPNGLHIRVSKF
ncbi:cytochrome P450 85A1 [Hevea brasiliensis]|nr:cytochrome P450 85A1 [Hevea brasiliensis]